MKPFLYATLSLLLMTACKNPSRLTIHGSRHSAPDSQTLPTPPIGKLEGDISPTTLIVMVDKEVGKEPLRKAVEEYGATVVYDYTLISGMAIRIPEGTDIHKARTHFRQVEGVTSVEYDRVHRLPTPVKPILKDK